MQIRPLPAFTSSTGYDGPVAHVWRALRHGAVRAATAELASLAVSPELTEEQEAAVFALRIEALLATGRLDEALSVSIPIKRALARAAGPSATQVATTMHLALGQIEEAVGDHGAALSHFTAAGLAGGDDALRPWRTGAAVALVRTGRRREGASLALEQVEVATVGHDDRALAMGLRTLAFTSPAHEPTEVLRRARGVAVGTGDRRLQAQIETDLAALLALSTPGDDTEPLALLRPAEAYSAAEGLWPMHTRVVRLLEHLGATPRPDVDDTLAQLTPAERRVARLAASGLTNRQIADQLLVTVKGVEWHLSRVYKKLGISSRTRLAGLIPRAS